MIMIKKVIRRLSASKVLAVAFLCFIVFVGTANMRLVFTETTKLIRVDEYDISKYVQTVGDGYTNMLSTRMNQPLLKNKGSYINLNGLMARLMGQRIMNECVKLDNGRIDGVSNLSYTDDYMEGSGDHMIELCRKQTQAGRYFLFVLAPAPTCKYDPQLPVGSQYVWNRYADELVDALRENDVPVLDLRETMHEQGISHDDAFFVTDLHWRPQTGFWAYAQIVERLKAMGAIPQVDTDLYTNIDNYDVKLYENWFLGSRGKRTGIYYAGVDDFHLIIPKFDTNISVKIPSEELELSGRFEDVAYDMERISRKDFFNLGPYATYGHANSPLTYWRNENAPIAKKAMLIGDSFGNVPFAFLPLCISTCDELDMRAYEGDFQSHYAEFEPDIVIMLVSPVNLKNSGNATYDFFPDEI